MSDANEAAERRRPSVTLQDVARDAGVHPSTVSRALDPARRGRVKESTRVHVVEVASRLGYRPDMLARGLKSGRTGMVGVIVADLGNTFVTPLIHGISAAIEPSQGLAIVAESLDDPVRLGSILDHLLSRRVDGIVVQGARTGDQPALEATNRLVPTILASRPLENTTLRQVGHDNEAGGRLVAEHLVSLGHRVIAQLEGPSDILNFPRRAAGFRSVAEQHGIREITLPDRAARPDAEEGRRLMESLLDSSPQLPTAVFAHNDLMALGSLTALKSRALRVPEDVSIVGYNDMPLAGHLSPPLTTIRYNTYEVGRSAGQLILDMLDGAEGEDVMLKPTLVSRGSSRRA